MNKISKKIVLGFLFTLIMLVSISAISATDTNTTSTQTGVQDVATQSVEPVEKATSTSEVTKKTQEKTDNKIKTTTKENKKETTKTQDTTTNIQKDTTKTIKNTDKTTTKNTTTNTKTIKTTTKSLKQETTPGTFTQLKDKIESTIKSGSTTVELEQNYTRGSSEDAITISTSMTIDGRGYTLNANGTDGIFVISSGNVILNNMTITNSTTSAITIQKGANVTENNINANNNIADYGGVNTNFGNLTINNGTYTNNTSKNDGGVNINYGNLTITGGIFTNNNAVRSGGVNFNENNGILTINNGIYDNNSVIRTKTGDSNTISSYGGVNYNAGNLTIINGTFTNNKATSISSGSKDGYSYSYGGVSYNIGNLTINNSTFINNTAISSSNSDNARVYSYGGVNYNIGNLTINNSTFTNNSATNSSTTTKQISYGYGGVNYNTGHGNITINNGNYTNNSATLFGGVNYHDNGNLTITGGLYINNTVTKYGGVNFNNCNITVTGGVYTNNSATFGGVNYNTGNITITDGTYTKNTATSKGGVNSNEYGNMTISNGTYNNNTATNGGVNYNYQSNLTITNGTYNNNTASYGVVNYNEKSNLIINNGNYTNNNGDYLVYNDYKSVFNVVNAIFINNTCSSDDLFNRKPDVISDNTYIGNNLTADTVTITPSITNITSRDSITANIIIKPNDMYNTTINSGNLTIYEDGEIVQSNPVNGNTSSISYTPHGGKYTLTIAYNDSTNSYKTTINRTITVNIVLETKVTINPITDSKVLKPITITGTVTDEDEQNVEGIVKITVGNEVFDDVALTDGVFTQEYTPTKIGSYTITVTYDGNSTHSGSNKTQEIAVNKLQTIITLDDITTKINDTTAITINVNDEQGNPITGGRVILKVNGKTLRDEKGEIVYATVNDGTATVDVIFNQKAGTYTLTTVYGGYSYYEASRNKNIKLTITPREAQLNFEDVKPTVIGDKISFKVKITDNNTPVNGGKVNIKINGKSLRDNNGNVIYAIVTNGIANVEFTLLDTFQAKTYNLTVVYASSTYERTENTTQLEITNPTNTLKTIDTIIITTAHTIKSNDSTTQSIITPFEDNTPKTVKI